MSKKRFALRLRGLAPALGAVLALAACGGASDPSPQPSLTPTPAPVKAVLMEASINSLPVDYVAGRYFTTSRTGTIDVTVDWTFPEDTIFVWVAKGQCTFEQFDAETCQYATESLATRPKPRLLSVPSAPAGTYTLIVGNLGPRDESVAFQVVQTSVSGASLSSSRGEVGPADGFLRARPRR